MSRTYRKDRAIFKRKAKEKQAFKNGSDIFPEFKKEDEYNWM